MIQYWVLNTAAAATANWFSLLQLFRLSVVCSRSEPFEICGVGFLQARHLSSHSVTHPVTLKNQVLNVEIVGIVYQNVIHSNFQSAVCQQAVVITDALCAVLDSTEYYYFYIVD